MNIFVELWDVLFDISTPSPTADPEPATDYRTILLGLVNEYRKANRLNELVLNDKLNLSALQFSNDAYINNIQNHKGTDGSTPFTRMSRVGYLYRWAGECMAVSDSPHAAFIQLMNSPPHYAIITGEHYTEIGIGNTGNRYVLDFGSTT